MDYSGNICMRIYGDILEKISLRSCDLQMKMMGYFVLSGGSEFARELKKVEREIGQFIMKICNENPIWSNWMEKV